MVGASYYMSIAESKDLEEYKKLLETIISLTHNEVTIISKGIASDWELSQLDGVVLPEMNELMQYLDRGQLYLKYGRHQRLLESAYILTDSLKTITDTQLGVHITMLQDKINFQT